MITMELKKKITFNSYITRFENDHFFNDIKKKYKLEDSNHLVDLIYEAIIFSTK